MFLAYLQLNLSGKFNSYFALQSSAQESKVIKLICNLFKSALVRLIFILLLSLLRAEGFALQSLARMSGQT